MRTILILDDDRVFRRLVVDALQKRGHRVLEAGRAVEADRVDSLLGIPAPAVAERK